MVSKGRQRKRALAATTRVKQGPVVYVEGGAKGELAVRARRVFTVLFEQLSLPMRPRVFTRLRARCPEFERLAKRLGA